MFTLPRAAFVLEKGFLATLRSRVIFLVREALRRILCLLASSSERAHHILPRMESCTRVMCVLPILKMKVTEFVLKFLCVVNTKCRFDEQ